MWEDMCHAATHIGECIFWGLGVNRWLHKGSLKWIWTLDCVCGGGDMVQLASGGFSHHNQSCIEFSGFNRAIQDYRVSLTRGHHCCWYPSVMKATPTTITEIT